MNHNCEICQKMKDLARHPFCIAFGIEQSDPRWEACEAIASDPNFRAEIEACVIHHAILDNPDTTVPHRFH